LEVWSLGMIRVWYVAYVFLPLLVSFGEVIWTVDRLRMSLSCMTL
jgi:hypothetical protein